MTLFLTIIDSVAIAFTVNGTGPFIDPGVLGAGLPEVQAALGVLAVSVYTVSLMVFEGYRRSRALAEQDDLLTAVFEGSPVASLVAVVDADGNGSIRRCNSAFAALVGRPATDMEGTAVDAWVAAEERAALRRLLRAARVRDGRAVQGEVVAVRPAGRILTRIGLATVGVTDGAPTRETWLVLHVEDVTEARRRERLLAEQATTDPLTGLANRRDLVQTLESRLSVVRPPAVVGVLFVDLDRFKNVNDRHGHDAGDRTLQAVAQCMARAVRPGDSLARFGGDEFVIVCPRLRGLDECEAVARRVQDEIRAVSAPYDHGGRIPVSIGAACSDDPDLDPEELIRQADRAMYLAKQRGGDRVVVSGQRVPGPSGRADDHAGSGDAPRPASGSAPVGW